MNIKSLIGVILLVICLSLFGSIPPANADSQDLPFEEQVLEVIREHPEVILEAANQQGKFWPYHDELFNQRQHLGEELYLTIAEQLNMDLEQFNRDRTAEAASIAIQQDIDLANQLGVQGTPFFLMNEETFSGAVPLAEIERKFSKLKS